MVMNAVDVEVERLLAEGKQAANAGDVAQARSYLTQVVERDPHNEQAWMWLSGVVGEPEEQQICLENVLVINPYNTKARKGLEFLSVKTGVPPHAPPVPIEGTAPLSDLSAYLDEPFSTQTQGNDASPPTMPTDMSLPPWLQSGSASQADSLAAPSAGSNLLGAVDDSFAQEAVPFAPSTLPKPAPASIAAALPNDPWGGMNVSDNSLGIDWSKGLETEAAPPQSSGFGTQQPDPSMFSQGYDASHGMYPVQGDGSNPGWALEGGPGFEPLMAGSMGFGNAADPYGQGQGGAQLPGWQDAGAYSPLAAGGDFGLPQPGDLPGYDANTQTEAKPWYAQSAQSSPQPTGMLSQHATGMLGLDPNGDEHTQHLATPKPVVMVECPNCHEQVPDTALACTQCNFGFFVNCPHCHELVDTIDARAGETAPCPYCNTDIDKMTLGMVSAEEGSTYHSRKPAKMEAAVPAMQHYVNVAPHRHGFSWAWVVDAMWLTAIVVLVWALTQLPMWLHLSGQYQ